MSSVHRDDVSADKSGSNRVKKIAKEKEEMESEEEKCEGKFFFL